MSESSELKVLQAMRLKGRVDEATVVATVDEDQTGPGRQRGNRAGERP